MTRKRPTMKDVAALAGVGFKTVSRVVNGEPGVSEETAEKVHRAVDQLHYRRDIGAGNLRRTAGRTDSLGLLLASVGNEFDAAINRSVEDTAQRHGLSVFTASTDEDPQRERQLGLGLLSRRVDGLILMSSRADLSYLQPEIDRGTPIIAVDRPPLGIEVDSVVADSTTGSQDAVSHLIEHGHRRIAVLTAPATLPTAAQRITGARRAWKASGLPADGLRVVDGLTTGDNVVRTVLELLDGADPPTAIFTARNQITTSAVGALQMRAAQHRIAQIGFDDFSHAELLDPSVSVVSQDPAQIGALATERLVARLEDPALPVEHRMLSTRLIRRRSCGCDG